LQPGNLGGVLVGFAIDGRNFGASPGLGGGDFFSHVLFVDSTAGRQKKQRREANQECSSHSSLSFPSNAQVSLYPWPLCYPSDRFDASKKNPIKPTI
jgi:hypothetical protein